MAAEGRWARKRAETRGRILDAARVLFLDKGYEASTIDEIAERADISKRSFFDYFPTKEQVIVSWQDEFSDLLIARVVARPAREPLARVVEHAMSEAIAASVSPEGVAMDRMVRDTPALAGHLHRKYARLERRLAEALAARGAPDDIAPQDRTIGQPALLAMIAVGALRLGAQDWRPGPGRSLETYTRTAFEELWAAIASLGTDK
ncbi:MAG: TetR/AcrR family transcriptional regulator [Gemmobacter sp.]|jgi:AcrR family transcriptional regulator|nr:TetR/AcrR family transcriptional regulator [Gemmobacter sp.]